MRVVVRGSTAQQTGEVVAAEGTGGQRGAAQRTHCMAAPPIISTGRIKAASRSACDTV